MLLNNSKLEQEKLTDVIGQLKAVSKDASRSHTPEEKKPSILAFKGKKRLKLANQPTCDNV